MQNVIVLGGSYAGTFPSPSLGNLINPYSNNLLHSSPMSWYYCSTCFIWVECIGSRAAHLLSQGLGNNYRVIMIDRNTYVPFFIHLLLPCTFPYYFFRACFYCFCRHANRASYSPYRIFIYYPELIRFFSWIDLYVIPRMSVLPGHEHKPCMLLFFSDVLLYPILPTTFSY